MRRSATTGARAVPFSGSRLTPVACWPLRLATLFCYALLTPALKRKRVRATWAKFSLLAWAVSRVGAQPISASPWSPRGLLSLSRFFLFYIFKKSKFQKYMSVLKNFENTPGRPPIGRQALSVIFFSNSQRGPWEKNAKGPVAPLLERPGYPPLYMPPTPHSLLI